MSAAAELLDQLVGVMQVNLPDGLTSRDLQGFVRRYRSKLEALVADTFLTPPVRPTPTRRLELAPTPDQPDGKLPPDLWTPKQRTEANILALQALASAAGTGLASAQERALMRRYSGWGGLSIDAVRSRVPSGLPLPEERGLIHEYYTPTHVAEAIAQVVRDLDNRNPVPRVDGVVQTLEPAAGIGRFVHAFGDKVERGWSWTAVEYSALSARMLRTLRPDITVFEGPFERWVASEAGEAARGRISLVVSNPPYGARGPAMTEDPVRDYREKKAYAYFLRRALDLLAPGGVGVFLVPSGFISGRGQEHVDLRRKVLLRHHLAGAFRLPSKLFPGAMLVTDVLFFRARGGVLSDVDDADQGILAGEYFKEFPKHILGREIGTAAEGEDDQTKKPRWGYQVEGTFEGIPTFVERPICAACVISNVVAFPSRAPKSRSVIRSEDAPVDGLPEPVAAAALLGQRVDRYLKLAAAGDSDEHVRMWGELVDALDAWTRAHGVPYLHAGVRDHAAGRTDLERFLSAWTKTGRLIPGLATKPVWTPRYAGRPDDLVQLAEWTFRPRHELSVVELAQALAAHRHIPEQDALNVVRNRLGELLDAGWCLDRRAGGWDDLSPQAVYLTGNLWEKLIRVDHGGVPPADAPKALVPRLQRQADLLRKAIKPVVFEDIEHVSARQGWIPVHVVQAWINETSQKPYKPVELERRGGLLQLAKVDYDLVSDAGLAPETTWRIGWINHDRTLFSPSKENKDEDADKARIRWANYWDRDFRAWLQLPSSADHVKAVEQSYNMKFRGYIVPTFPAEPLRIARWAGVKLHPHQNAGARRLLAHRGGLLAFDVGVGKTYTGLAVMAAARQEGWCRRPVIVVPNSIAWKWEADIRRVLPDYRIAVIGSKIKTVARGARKGEVTSETDTPEDRAAKWTRFQAGEYDVVILTYTALGRTRLNEDAVRSYASSTAAIQREIRLRQRNAKETKKPTERQVAILKEGISAWIAEQMEIPEGWEYDPGVAWDDIGIDLLIVDEAQNYKNLYLPEPREGGVPRFMGNAGDGSKRAWQLDFRAAAVRAKHGGRAGVVLLSATPAKNSPLEFYSLIQYVDHDAWTRMGIGDPEQFIDRYLKIEMTKVLDSKMDVTERSAVTGFLNLHELRDVVFRYGEFKTAEDVGLKLPEPRVEIIEVDMDATQDAKYADYVGQIEAMLNSPDRGEKGKMLGLLARMALVAVHGHLDEGYDWKTAERAPVAPASPKFAALAARVKRNAVCGHIVFCDNVAAHRWIVQTLVQAGIRADRIAVLNAEVAKAAADRQRIAREFNGDPEQGLAPKYDIVIANAIAYEGIDLQTRTCAIHHLDLPWEPATLQQRNGRGVRQGNTLSAIEINYYFARRSQDGLRYSLIQGKLGWMTDLIKSTKRATNNPGAQLELGPDDILLLISRNPEETRKRLEAAKKRRQLEAMAEVAKEAGRLLRGANTRFRRAERAEDPADALKLRAEAEQIITDLQRVDPVAWPFARVAPLVRERDLAVTPGGIPIVEGTWMVVQNSFGTDLRLQFGRHKDGKFGKRAEHGFRWEAMALEAVDGAVVQFEARERLAQTFVDVVEEADRAELLAKWVGEVDYWMWGAFAPQGVDYAADSWLVDVWRHHARELVGHVLRDRRLMTVNAGIPVLNGELRLIGRASEVTGVSAEHVLPPTQEGWTKFLAVLRTYQGPLTWTQFAGAADYWFRRHLPRGVMGREEA